MEDFQSSYVGSIPITRSKENLKRDLRLNVTWIVPEKCIWNSQLSSSANFSNYFPIVGVGILVSLYGYKKRTYFDGVAQRLVHLLPKQRMTVRFRSSSQWKRAARLFV